MRPVLEGELQRPIDEVFEDFDPQPRACGSMAQVYRARLRATGAPVAIKVQKPSMEKAVQSDLDLLGWLAGRLHDGVDELRAFDLPGLVEEARQGIAQELDFTIESRNAAYFNSVNPDPEHVFAPQVCEALTTRRLLVCEWVEGLTPEEAAPGLPRQERSRLAIAGGRSIFHQIMMSGFFHADPHSGNILITPEGRICFLDWGLAGQLTREMRYFLADLFTAVGSQNPEAVVRVVVMMAQGRVRIDRTVLEKEVSFVLRKYQYFNTRSEAVGRVMIDLIQVFARNHVQVARDYALLGKAVLSIEEAGKSLDPDFDIRTIATPFIKDLSWERHNPVNVLKQSYWTLLSALRQIRDLPAEAHRVLRRVESGEFSIRMKHEGVEAFGAQFQTAVNHLVMAIIIGALIIGCSMIITTDVRPHLWGYPVIGILGFIFSALLGLWLLWDIFRSSGRR